MNNKILISITIDKELLQRIDDEVLKIKYAKSKPQILKSRGGFISYALDEYLKLPQVTRYFMSKVEK
jgi:metal-responsive CopG/Arc/MetJ family transcriptional regulator